MSSVRSTGRPVRGGVLSVRVLSLVVLLSSVLKL